MESSCANSEACSQESSPDVCRFYRNGKCFYADKCFNLHEGDVPQSAQKSKSSVKQNKTGITDVPLSEKGPSLRTAGDVRRRIQWDELLPEKDFTVGYLDRFDGVVEKPFSAFTWKHLATVDIDDLAIPEHRIHYFSYKGHKVWDKNIKLDHVFGSANNDKTIVQAMKDIDEEVVRKFEEESSDSDDDLEIVIGAVSKGLSIDKAMRFKSRATHFLCIQVSNPLVHEKVEEVQKSILKKDLSLNQCIMPTELLHITVAMVNCPNEDSVLVLNDKLKNLRSELSELESFHQSHTIRAKRLNTFGSRVLYAELDVPDLFNDLVESVRSFIVKTPDLILTNHFDFIPHMTLLKVNRPTARLRRSKYIDSFMYQDYIDVDFGNIEIDNLKLCVIDDCRGIDGFYMTCSNAYI